MPRRALLASLAVPFAFAGGIALSLQAFVNGRFAGSLGSAEIAAAVNNVTGLAFLLLLASVTGVPQRATQRLRTARRPRLWQLLAGANGAFFVFIVATAAPKVGIAVLTVSLVCGQLAGGSLIDRIGLGPAGRRPITLMRALGVALAVVAVAIGVNGSDGDLHLGLLLLAALAGAGAALQHAAMGHIAGATGEPLAAAVLNFAVGLIVILVVAAAVTGGSPAGGWSAPPGEWLGGVLGATSAVVIAAAVRRLGVLRLTLVLIAGQSVGALVLDFVAPAEGEHVTVLTFVSVLLTIGAVYVSGLARAGAPVSEASPASRTP